MKPISFLIAIYIMAFSHALSQMDATSDAWVDNSGHIITGGTFSGGVGIGLTVPNAKLEINHGCSTMLGLRITGNALCSSGDPFEIRELTTGGMFNTLFYVQGGSGNVGIRTNAPTASLHIKGSGTSIKVENGPDTYLTLDGAGNLGIGTNSTITHKVVIEGQDFTLLKLQNSATGTADKTALIDLRAGATGHSWRMAVGSTNNGIGIVNGEFYLENANSQPVLRLNQSGQLILGESITSIPSNTNYRLLVQSGILAERLKVAVKSTTDWADYVFDEQYSLLPIDSVAAFVKENKHLPNVPSADCMVEDGLDVARTDAMLMAKIEELQLYIIQLNDRIRELEYNR